MKKFIDIENKRTDTELRKGNIDGFKLNDDIVITEKLDGSNSQVCYEDGVLHACSRRLELNHANTLNGFWNFVQNDLATNPLFMRVATHLPHLVWFGEWNLNGNKIKSYNKKWEKTWVVYHIYDTKAERWWDQDAVQYLCKEAGLEFIHVLYDGKFTGWADIEEFLHKNTYGEMQEGIVICNESAKARNEVYGTHDPWILKIVNTEFSEKMKKTKREKTAEEIAELDKCAEIVAQIVTRRRVEKGIERLRDDGILPMSLTPADMKIVAQHLPKEIYNDCVKEENDLVIEAGEHFGKQCGQATMKHAREIILG